MTDHVSGQNAPASSPSRRLVAAGITRRLDDRTLTVRITEAGATGRITPATSGGPVCCGRPMRADHGQYVCDRCGAWTNPGTSRATPADIYAAAATADHNAHCTHCRAQDAETEALHARYATSTARRDRIQLGLHTTRTEAVTSR
jgi:hypothetical protein